MYIHILYKKVFFFTFKTRPAVREGGGWRSLSFKWFCGWRLLRETAPSKRQRLDFKIGNNKIRNSALCGVYKSDAQLRGKSCLYVIWIE
jgi:hypothetical protein